MGKISPATDTAGAVLDLVYEACRSNGFYFSGDNVASATEDSIRFKPGHHPRLMEQMGVAGQRFPTVPFFLLHTWYDKSTDQYVLTTRDANNQPLETVRT